MNKVTLLIKNGGVRTLLKSFRAYNKGRAYSQGRPLSAFLVNGSTLIDIEKSASIVNRGIFRLGLHAHDFLISTARCALRMVENTTLQINGTVRAGPGVHISIIRKNALLEFCGDVYINSNSRLICCKHIKIGKGVFISWDVEICDSDFHEIMKEGFEKAKEIEIGDKVWIGSRVTILKGVRIGAGSVIATGAVVTKDVPEKCLVAGVPGRVIRENVQWKL